MTMPGTTALALPRGPPYRSGHLIATYFNVPVVIATIKLLTMSYQQDPRLMHAFVHHDVYASSMIAEVRIL